MSTPQKAQQEERKEAEAFDTPDKSGSNAPKTSITPAKPGAARRLDVSSTALFQQQKKRRTEGGLVGKSASRKISQEEKPTVYEPISIYRTEIYEAKVGNKPDPDECWGSSARKEFLAEETNRNVYNFVVEHFVVPPDFDSSLAYGARSGTCHEQRLVRAYKNKLLRLKESVRSNYCFS